jgi:hypothetical protein
MNPGIENRIIINEHNNQTMNKPTHLPGGPMQKARQKEGWKSNQRLTDANIHQGYTKTAITQNPNGNTKD